MSIEEGETIKVVTCGQTDPHNPHFWHAGQRLCFAGADYINNDNEIILLPITPTGRVFPVIDGYKIAEKVGWAPIIDTNR